MDKLTADIAARTDSYFNRTKRIVARFGDKRVTYAIFLRRPVICAPRLMLDWLQSVSELRDSLVAVNLVYKEGDWVGVASRAELMARALASRPRRAVED